MKRLNLSYFNDGRKDFGEFDFKDGTLCPFLLNSPTVTEDGEIDFYETEIVDLWS